MNSIQGKDLGIGIIGYSVGKIHIHAWLDLHHYVYPPPAHPCLISICGRNEKLVRETSKQFGFRRYHTDWIDLIKDPEVQVVDICAPPNIHEDVCLEAIDRGKHILCEKPLARNAKEAKNILDAADRANITHMTGYNFRFIPAIMLARKLIQEGYIGRIFHFRGNFLSVELGEEGYVDPNAPLDSAYLMNKEIGGSGALHDLGTHVIDLARFLVGEPKSVTAASETFIKERPISKGSEIKGKVDVDDATFALLRFENGALGTLEASWMAPGRKSYHCFEVNGSLGSIKFNWENINELEVYSTQDRRDLVGFRKVITTAARHPTMDRFNPNYGGAFGIEHSFINEIAHFVESLVEGKSIDPQGATFYDGYRNCLIMDAILKSTERERWEVI